MRSNCWGKFWAYKYNTMLSDAYEVYKKSVGGRTFNGEKMKEFDELPENIKDAWLAIDIHYKDPFNRICWFTYLIIQTMCICGIAVGGAVGALAVYSGGQ